MRIFGNESARMLVLAAVMGVFLIAGMGVNAAVAVPLFEENFDYLDGTALNGTGGWAAHSGAGTNPLTVRVPGLSYAGYPGSGIAVPWSRSAPPAPTSPAALKCSGPRSVAIVTWTAVPGVA